MQYSDFITESDRFFLSDSKSGEDAVRLIRASNRMHPADRAEQRDLSQRRTWIMYYMYEASRGRIHVPQSCDDLDDF